MTILTCEGLRFSYGRTEVVHDVGFTVAQGELFALLGTNGAGKTTLLEMLTGQRKPSGGTVSVLGGDRRGLGVVPQEGGCAGGLTARETVRLWLRLHGRKPDAEAVLDEVRLGPQAGRRVRQLSGGERRRLDLAVALCGEPRLLILDEPTSGLDPQSRTATWTVLRERLRQGVTILLTTHYLEEAEALADRVAIMDSGRIAVCGTTAEVRQSGTLAEAFHRIAGEVSR